MDQFNSLKLKHLHRYRLYIQYNESTFHSSTTIPGSFTISNIKEGDTLHVPGSNLSGSTVFNGLFPIEWIPSNNAFFYRRELARSNVAFVSLDHTFENNDSKIGLFFDTSQYPLSSVFSGQVTICAIDSNYGKLYMPGDSWTGSDGYNEYMSQVEDMKLPQRSNIVSNTKAVGVFGSYSSDRVNFFLKAKSN